MKRNLMKNAIYNEYNVDELETSFKFVSCSRQALDPLATHSGSLPDKLASPALRAVPDRAEAPRGPPRPRPVVHQEARPDHLPLRAEVSSGELYVLKVELRRSIIGPGQSFQTGQ